MTETSQNTQPPTRSCGDCTLCCKVMGIDALEKPRGSWCTNCDASKGCKIYETKPQECTDFQCGYITNPNLGEEWKPNHSKIIILPEDGGNRIAAHVDTSRPDAWKKEPYYSTLKEWARRGVPTGGQFIVYVGDRVFMILPDKDVDLGIIGKDERVIMINQQTPSGIKQEPIKVHKDDPQLKAA